MTSSDKDVIGEIESEIEAYLKLHPDAADTVTGIQQWWLAPGTTMRSEQLIETALTRLALRGLAQRDQLPDGTVIYRGKRRDV